MSAPIGYDTVHAGQVGWNGDWGTVPMTYQHPVVPPADNEIAVAEVLTQWTCPFCGEDNEVAGEGAVDSWMECSGCQRNAWLVMG